MASRELGMLHPAIRTLCQRHVEACRDHGIDLLVYVTYRSSEEQDALYAQGRTGPGKIVTNARGGKSKHNHLDNGAAASLAYDCVPLVAGKAAWSDADTYRRVGEIGEELGLTWAGRWRGSLRETAHFEISL